MSKFKDFFSKNPTFDKQQLYNTAAKVLQRNGADATKALGPFINNLRISPEVRALIGPEIFEETATAYLGTLATDMRGKQRASAKAEETGGVRISSDSQQVGGPAGATSHGSAKAEGADVAHNKNDSHRADGHANLVTVIKHTRKPPKTRPGNASRGLAEAQAAAKLVPAVYAPMLSDGRKVKPMMVREARQEQPKRIRDGVYLDMLLLYAQPPSEQTALQDYIPDAHFKQCEAWADEYMALVKKRITMTVEAFVTMKQQPIAASPEHPQVSA